MKVHKSKLWLLQFFLRRYFEPIHYELVNNEEVILKTDTLRIDKVNYLKELFYENWG